MAVLHAREWGPADGVPVVCLHGMTAHGGRYAALARRLPQARVVAVDLRGHGHSTWDPPWDIDTHVNDVLDTCDQLGIGEASWIGHSFGARIAREVAGRRPDRVRDLVLLDPVLRLSAGEAGERARAVRDESFVDEHQAVDAKHTGTGLISTPRREIEEDAQLHLEQSEDGRWRWRFQPPALVVALSDLVKPPPPSSVPTLMVLGADSWVAVHKEDLAGASVVVVPGGHVVLWDAFEETTSAVEEYFARRDGQRRRRPT